MPPRVLDAVLKQAQYRPVSLRRRALILLLAVATTVTVVLMMLGRWGAPEIPRPPPPPDAAACAEGQLGGCVGGKADVILVPAGRAASAAPAGGAR